MSVRVHPEQDCAEAQAAVIGHLRDVRPFGIELDVRPGQTGNGFAADTTGPAYAAARSCWAQAWGAEVMVAGSGGSIPIVSALTGALPEAEALLVGTTDGYANIHGPNERVLFDEFERAIVAETRFFGEYAARWVSPGSTRDRLMSVTVVGLYPLLPAAFTGGAIAGVLASFHPGAA